MHNPNNVYVLCNLTSFYTYSWVEKQSAGRWFMYNLGHLQLSMWRVNCTAWLPACLIHHTITQHCPHNGGRNSIGKSPLENILTILHVHDDARYSFSTASMSCSTGRIKSSVLLLKLDSGKGGGGWGNCIINAVSYMYRMNAIKDVLHAPVLNFMRQWHSTYMYIWVWPPHTCTPCQDLTTIHVHMYILDTNRYCMCVLELSQLSLTSKNLDVLQLVFANQFAFTWALKDTRWDTPIHHRYSTHNTVHMCTVIRVKYITEHKT